MKMAFWARNHQISDFQIAKLNYSQTFFGICGRLNSTTQKVIATTNQNFPTLPQILVISRKLIFRLMGGDWATHFGPDLAIHDPFCEPSGTFRKITLIF